MFQLAKRLAESQGDVATPGRGFTAAIPQALQNVSSSPQAEAVEANDQSDAEVDNDDDEGSSSDDSFLSYFDDSDDDDHEEETQAARDQREQARNAVLQAAGLSVRRPPPGVPGPRKPRRRAPPQPPATEPQGLSAGPFLSPPLPAAKPRDQEVVPVGSGPDAYDRYEAYLAKTADATSRARSQSDARPVSLAPSSPRPGSAVQTPPATSSSAIPLSSGREGKLAGFVSRISAGASQTVGDRRTTPAISGPVSVVRVEDGQSSGESSGPTTWSNLVDAELLKNITPQERKHQEV